MDIQDSPSHSDSPCIDIEHIMDWDVQEDVLDNVLKKIRPLDLIFFSGENLFSKTIKLVERKKYGLGTVSHVAIVINKTLMNSKQMKEDRLYMWESTSIKSFHQSVKDIYGKTKCGVQIRDLEQVIRNYNGTVFWGKLTHNPYKNSKREFLIERFKYLEDKYGKSGYNLSFIDLAASVYSFLRPIRKIKKWIKRKKHYIPLFCSEFIALIYTELEIIDKEKVVASNIVPVDFLGITEKGIPLILKKIVEIDKST
jgi:hypothetical protein